MFLCFELSFGHLTGVKRLDNGINLSTKVTEPVSYRIADFWSLNGKTILMGASCSSDTYRLEHTFSVIFIFINKTSDGVLYEVSGQCSRAKTILIRSNY